MIKIENTHFRYSLLFCFINIKLFLTGSTVNVR